MKMNLIDGCSEVLGAPKGWDHEKAACHGLPVRYQDVDGVPCVLSSWQPSFDELMQMAMGQPVILYVAGRAMPPVSLQVGDRLHGVPA